VIFIYSHDRNIAVRCEECGGTLCVAVTGEIDHHNARGIRTEIDEKLYLYRPKKVELDTSGVTFMDSSGLGLILGRFTLAKELGGTLSVVNPSDNVMKILSLAGTSRLFPIERRVDNEKTDNRQKTDTE